MNGENGPDRAMLQMVYMAIGRYLETGEIPGGDGGGHGPPGGGGNGGGGGHGPPGGGNGGGGGHGGGGNGGGGGGHGGGGNGGGGGGNGHGPPPGGGGNGDEPPPPPPDGNVLRLGLNPVFFNVQGRNAIVSANLLDHSLEWTKADGSGNAIPGASGKPQLASVNDRGWPMEQSVSQLHVQPRPAGRYTVDPSGAPFSLMGPGVQSGSFESGGWTLNRTGAVAAFVTGQAEGMKLYLPDHHGMDFNQAYVDKIKEAKIPALRVTHSWQLLSYVPSPDARNGWFSNWETRTKMGDARQAATQGVSIEFMARFARKAGTSLWMGFPADADETYIKNLAQLLKDEWGGYTAHIRIEYGNEPWNSGLAAGQFVGQDGRVAGQNFAQQIDWFKEVWDDPRVLFMALGATVNAQFAQDMVNELGSRVHEVGCNGYLVPASRDVTSPQELVDVTRASFPRYRSAIAAHRAIADSLRVPLVVYEVNKSWVGNIGAQADELPDATELLREIWTALEEEGVTIACAHNHMMEQSGTGGAWGHEHNMETRRPQMAALVEWNSARSGASS